MFSNVLLKLSLRFVKRRKRTNIWIFEAEVVSWIVQKTVWVNFVFLQFWRLYVTENEHELCVTNFFFSCLDEKMIPMTFQKYQQCALSWTVVQEQSTLFAKQLRMVLQLLLWEKLDVQLMWWQTSLRSNYDLIIFLFVA